MRSFRAGSALMAVLALAILPFGGMLKNGIQTVFAETLNLSAQVETTVPAAETPPAYETAEAFIVKKSAQTKDGISVSAASDGESAALVKDGGNLTLSNASVSEMPGASASDAPSAPALSVLSGGMAKVSKSVLSSDAPGSDAMAVSGQGSKAVLSDSSVSTSAEEAAGISAEEGGDASLQNVGVETDGANSPALQVGDAASRITAADSALSTRGTESPLLSVAGELTAMNLSGASEASPIMELTGDASVSIAGSDLQGAGSAGILIAPGEGDSEDGVVSLHVQGGKLSVLSGGPLIQMTDGEAEVSLSGCTVTAGSGVLARVTVSEAEESAAARLTLKCVGQVVSGDVTADNRSTLQLILMEGSIFTGAVNGRNEGQTVSVELDALSTWILTGDTHVDALTDALTDLTNIQSGGYTLYYDASNEANAWIGGATVTLLDGGTLTPEP